MSQLPADISRLESFNFQVTSSRKLKAPLRTSNGVFKTSKTALLLCHFKVIYTAVTTQEVTYAANECVSKVKIYPSVFLLNCKM